MVIATLSVINQANKVRLFEKTFLIANVSPNVVLITPFLTLSSGDINFLKKQLW